MRTATTVASSRGRARSELVARLQSRREEIEGAGLNRLQAISDPGETLDLTYIEGLRAAISAALDYGLDAIERSTDRRVPIPAPLLSQARLAARSGVSLDTVLRRCFAGYTLLGDYLMGELEDGELLEDVAVKRLLRVQATLFDRLMAALAEEYIREANERHVSTEERRAERVKQILDGELLDTTELAYDFEGHHLAIVAQGDDALEAIREFANALDRLLLAVCPEEGMVWAWLGGRRSLDAEEALCLAASSCPAETHLSLGEPGEGLTGWRLSHRQASAALPIALRGSQSVVRYAEVAMLASILQDDLLATSLQQLYLTPLEVERDGGEIARQTLRAYFTADRNVSSAAAMLGVNRSTVSNRLHAIEERLGSSLSDSKVELEAALRLDELNQP